MLELPQGEVHVWVVGLDDLYAVLAQYIAGPLQFGKAAHGKPFLAGDSDVCFNLSHSGPVALVAVARREVGIDVEQRRSVHYEARVASRIMTTGELARYQALDESGRTDFLLWVWTRKEALVKASGEGIRGPLREVDCEPRPTDRWQVADLDVPGCVAAVAAEGTDWAPRLFDGARLPMASDEEDR